MKRTIAAIALAISASLGLAACSGSDDAAPEPDVETTAPAEEEAADDPAAEEVVEDDSAVSEADEVQASTPDLSTLDACVSLMEPLQEANLAMAELAQAADDPQNAVDMWRALSESFESFGETAGNAEVAELATAVGEDGHALTDVLQKVYVDEDMSAMGEFTEANDAFFASYQEILGLCDTNQ